MDQGEAVGRRRAAGQPQGLHVLGRAHRGRRRRMFEETRVPVGDSAGALTEPLHFVSRLRQMNGQRQPFVRCPFNAVAKVLCRDGVRRVRADGGDQQGIVLWQFSQSLAHLHHVSRRRVGAADQFDIADLADG